MAVAAASRGYAGRSGLSHSLRGLGYLARLRELHEALESGTSDIADRCQKLLAKIAEQPLRLALIGDGVSQDDMVQAALDTWNDFNVTAPAEVPMPLTAQFPQQSNTPPIAFTTGTSVNYTGVVMPGVHLTHPDAPILAVAARYLTNGFLHTAIREQGGAYGASAGSNSSIATFTISTYRDPRLQESFDDIDRGLEWLQNIDNDERPLREAILSVLANLDSPGSPAGDATGRFVQDLQGREPFRLNAYRSRVMDVTPEDIRRVAREHLSPDKASRAVITNPDAAKTLSSDWVCEAL